MEEKIIIERETEEMKEDGMEFFPQTVSANAVGTPGHIHDTIEIVLITAGSFRIFIDDAEYSAKQGDLILFRSNTIHGVYAESQPYNEYYVLKIKPSSFFELASEKNVMQYLLRFVIADKTAKTHWTADILKNSEIEAAFSELMREYHAEGVCRDISLKLAAYRVILAMLRDMMQKEDKNKLQSAAQNIASQVYRSIQYINHHYNEDLDAGLCAELVSMSYSYFSRSFRKITGRTFKQYLNEVRIRHAEQLLMTTDYSVTRIASECGYNNVSYFISVYKSLRGSTPFSNRKLHLSEST